MESEQKGSIEVLHLSLPRTGTVSLQQALRILGINVYHGGGVTLKQPLDIPRWMRAARAKFQGQGPRFEREDWDKLFLGFDAVSNLPCIAFADELRIAYPEAKVILVQRDPTAWVESFSHVFARLYDWRTVLIARFDRALLGPYREMMLYVAGNFFGAPPLEQSKDQLKATYLEYCEHIRRTTPANKLLEYQIGSGWEPLCAFLGRPVPSEPFPISNDRQSHSDRFNRTANAQLAKWIVYPILLAILLWSAL